MVHNYRSRAKQESLEEIRQRAFALYVEHHEFYTKLHETYTELYRRKKELGIRPLEMINKVRWDVWYREYPRITFFELNDKQEAVEFLQTLEFEDVKQLIEDIKETLGSNFYRNVRDWIYETDYFIRNKGNKSTFGFDPSGPTSSRCFSNGYTTTTKRFPGGS